MQVTKTATEKEVKEVVLEFKMEYGVVEKVGAISEECTHIESTVERMLQKPSKVRRKFKGKIPL